mgnify:CR=1 FL=1
MSGVLESFDSTSQTHYFIVISCLCLCLEMSMPYTTKQKKLARIAPPRNKITRADFDVLNKKSKTKKKKKRT